MNIDKKTLRSIFLGAFCCILLYWLLHETERVQSVLMVLKNIFSPFVVGAALAFILNVPMRGIERLLQKISHDGLRRGLALLLTFIALILVLALVFYLLIPQLEQTVMSLIDKLPAFFKQLQANVTDYLNDHPEMMEWVVANTDLEKLDWTNLIQKATSMLGNSVTAIMNSAFSAIGSIASAVVDAVIGIVFALYCLFRKEILARQGRRLIYAFLPERICDQMIRILRLTNSTFSNFISGRSKSVV